MILKRLAALLLIASSGLVHAQEKVGDHWVDNNLSLKVVSQSIKTDGRLTICVADTSRDLCVENLQTGFEIKAYDASGKMLWEGIGSGRTRQVQLPNPLPNARFITLKAFKPWVTNKRTGNLIHQDKTIEIKYYLP